MFKKFAAVAALCCLAGSAWAGAGEDFCGKLTDAYFACLDEARPTGGDCPDTKDDLADGLDDAAQKQPLKEQVAKSFALWEKLTEYPAQQDGETVQTFVQRMADG